MSSSEPRLPVFLGIAERASVVTDGNTAMRKWNILGLRTEIPSILFPLPFPQWHLALALPPEVLDDPTLHFVFVDETEKELGSVTMSLARESNRTDDYVEAGTYPVGQQSWTLVLTSLGRTGILVHKPGVVDVRFGSASGKVVGQLNFVLVDPIPLGPEQVAATRTDPSATKAVRLAYSCRLCTDSIRTYAALDRDEATEAGGWIWYSDLPDEFQCNCGEAMFSLESARKNLHGLLGRPGLPSNDVEFIPLYEQGTLAKLRASFLALLGADAREEIFQKFIEANPVLLHTFPAVLFFTKPPLLTYHFADFAIVTPQKELLLVEIEKPSTRLLRKDGGQASDLVHALDQVRSWLHVADEHRLAVLDSLKIDRRAVGSVRGIVIAGRDQGADAHHLRCLKGQDLGRISLLTYDDLLCALDSLIERIGRL